MKTSRNRSWIEKIELEKKSQIFRRRNVRQQVINNRPRHVIRLDMEFDGEVTKTAVLDMLQSTLLH